MNKMTGIIISGPTPATLAYVADYQRRKLVREVRAQNAAAGATAAKWAKPARPFADIGAIGAEFRRRQAEANRLHMYGRQPDGKFISRATRREALALADKLSALGFGK